MFSNSVMNRLNIRNPTENLKWPTTKPTNTSFDQDMMNPIIELFSVISRALFHGCIGFVSAVFS